MTSLRAILFDLDGTLIDSIGLIVDSYRHTLQAHDKPPLTDEEWLAGVGTPLTAQLGRFAADETELTALIATYRTYNLEHHDERVRAYPGAVQAVERLAARGLTIGIVTSKARVTALRGLHVSGFETEFQVVIGSDDVDRHKPDPTPVLAALEILGIAPEHALYAGDSPHDIAAGNGAGVRTAACMWGPFMRHHLEPQGPDVWLEQPHELGELV